MTLNKMPEKQTKHKRSFPPLFLNTFMLGSTCTAPESDCEQVKKGRRSRWLSNGIERKRFFSEINDLPGDLLRSLPRPSPIPTLRPPTRPRSPPSLSVFFLLASEMTSRPKTAGAPPFRRQLRLASPRPASHHLLLSRSSSRLPSLILLSSSSSPPRVGLSSSSTATPPPTSRRPPSH